MTDKTTTGSDAVDLDKLEALAKAATPGPWERGDGKLNGNDLMVYGEDYAGAAIVEMRSDANFTPRERRIQNLDFIAAANPATVLSLIAQARAAAPSLLSADELAAFNRFCECCEDFDSGGYDVGKDMMAKLARIGVVRSTGFGRYETTAYGDSIRSARAAAPAAIPEGYKLVPIEPTEEMIRAACLNQATLGNYATYEDWWNDHSSGISEKIRSYVAGDYRVMVASAPVIALTSPSSTADGSYC